MNKIQKAKVWYARRQLNKFRDALGAKYGPVWWKDVHPNMSRAEYFRYEKLNESLSKAWATKPKKHNLATVENGRKLREEDVTGRIVSLSEHKPNKLGVLMQEMSYSSIPVWWSESEYYNGRHMPTKDSRSWRQKKHDREKREAGLKARREQWKKDNPL